MSFMHILIVMVILLIFFGPGRLPDLGNSLGKTIRDFKKALDDGQAALNDPKAQGERKPEAVASETVGDASDSSKKASERKDPSS